MKKVVMLVNKAFEYEGFRRGVADVYAHRDFTGTLMLNEDEHKKVRPFTKPIATYSFKNLDVDVYCIEYLFGRDENSSNSEVKYNLLVSLLNSIKETGIPDYVVSVSTSESTLDSQGGESSSANGCVYVGNRFFLSDQRSSDPDTKSHLDIPVDYFADAVILDSLYDCINAAKMDLRPVPRASASILKCVASPESVCLGVVNVMNYACYPKADKAAYEACGTSHGERIGIETTHGVVKMAVANTLGEKVPVMFVSPITDRYEKFSEDVGDDGEQNFACSYNGGVATANILALLDKLLQTTTKAVEFCGSPMQYTRTAQNIASYNFGSGAFSVEAWIKSTKGGTVISRKPTPGGSGNGGFLLVIKPSGVITLATDDGFRYRTIDTVPTTVLDGAPHHVLGCRDNCGKMTIFVDFKAVDSSVGPGSSADTLNVNCNLGMSVGSVEQEQEKDRFFSGLVGECRIWRTAKIYSGKAEWKCIDRMDRDLVARWDFSQSDGSDTAFNSHRLTLKEVDFSQFEI